MEHPGGIPPWVREPSGSRLHGANHRARRETEDMKHDTEEALEEAARAMVITKKDLDWKSWGLVLCAPSYPKLFETLIGQEAAVVDGVALQPVPVSNFAAQGVKLTPGKAYVMIAADSRARVLAIELGSTFELETKFGRLRDYARGLTEVSRRRGGFAESMYMTHGLVIVDREDSETLGRLAAYGAGEPVANDRAVTWAIVPLESEFFEERALDPDGQNAMLCVSKKHRRWISIVIPGLNDGDALKIGRSLIGGVRL
jgi:hypothetical protein